MDDEGEVLQRIEPAASVGLPVIVLPQGDVERFQAAFSSEKLDISIVPLIRTVLLDLGAERYVLLIRVHDIAYDGWSVSILVRELNVLYRAYCRGEPDPLAPLEVQYADYASWKMRRAGPEELKRQLGYWQKQLAGVSDLLALPTDHPRSGAQRFRGAHLYRVFPLQLLEDLRALGREEGSTLFALLMSAFNVLLWERSGQQDIPIGTLTFDRVMPGLENVIGAFLNTIVLRTRLQPRASFVEFLRRVDSTARAAYQNLDVPFESVVQTVNQKRTRSYMPLFQVMFAMQNTPSETVRLWKLELERMELLAQGARFDLLLRTTELEDGLGVWMEYNVDLFEAETIAAWVDRFRVLLEQLVTDPHRPLAQLASGLHLSSHSSLATRSMPGDSSMDM
jgi:hypothetical protein